MLCVPSSRNLFPSQLIDRREWRNIQLWVYYKIEPQPTEAGWHLRQKKDGSVKISLTTIVQ